MGPCHTCHVYVTHNHVFSESSLWHVRDQDQKKTTLLLAALKSVEISEEERLSANEIAILFPYHSDYEFIADQCAPSFTRIQGNDSAKVFKKVNTKIEIGETKINVLFTPLSLVKWKCFGIDNIKAPSRSKTRQWERL